MCRRPVGRMPLRTRSRRCRERDRAFAAGGTLAALLDGGGFRSSRLARGAGRGEQVASDDHALYFASALVDGKGTRIAVHPLDIGFAGIADAAVDLHSLVHDT